MLRLPKKTLYALEAVVDIAYNGRPEPVQSKEITARQGIPQRYLEPVMQQLVRAGVLRGVRGPRGGYRLARERRRISVGEIVRIVGDMNGGEGVDEDGGSALGRLVVRPLWRELRDELMRQLDAVTIEDLCKRAEGAGAARAQREPEDFSI